MKDDNTQDSLNTAILDVKKALEKYKDDPKIKKKYERIMALIKKRNL